ncbi:MAG: DivIVA domain-containing protein [Metamycoplasmataceae bacterium]
MKLSYKKIVDKKFETVINGYSPTQVDMFLDKICLDYMDYEKRIGELEAEIENLRNENASLTESLFNAQNGFTSENTEGYQSDNDGEYQDDIHLEVHGDNQESDPYENYAEYTVEENEEEIEESLRNN